MNFNQTSFVTSASTLKECPEQSLAEVAFSGRSNAGKSSAINTLCNQSRLARISKTPGRTTEINFFKVNDGLKLVDLPGYGFAKSAKSQKKDWGPLLRDYFKKNIINSGISQIIIERTSKKCIVSVYTSRPGFVIGKKGTDIDKIKKKLSVISSSEIVLNIKEVKKPELNAFLVAENIAQQLVKRIAYRRAMKRAMQSALRLGAKGIRVCLAGRLAGNEIARTEWLRDGSIPSHTLRADIDYAEAEALTTYGIIGIKVWIYKGEVFAREFSQETNKVTPKEGKQ